MEIIRLLDMPTSIHGATLEDSEGDYNVYINGRLCESERAVALAHELAHAKSGHTQGSLAFEEMEAYAKKKELESRRQILREAGHQGGGRTESP